MFWKKLFETIWFATLPFYGLWFVFEKIWQKEPNLIILATIAIFVFILNFNEENEN